MSKTTSVRAYDFERQQQQFSQSLLGAIDIDSSWIAESNRLTRQQQLAVYQASSHENMVKALLSVFGCCTILVGEAFMHQVISRYVNANPCKTDSYIDYAKAIPAFIASSPAAAQVQYLAEVAELDWAWDKVFSGEPPLAATSCGLQQGLEMHGDMLELVLPGHVVLLRGEYPLLNLWRACHDADFDTEQVNLEPNRYYHVVWLQHDEVVIAELDSATYAVLDFLHQPHALAQLCQKQAEMPAEKLVSVVSHALDVGWLDIIGDPAPSLVRG